MAEHVLDIHEVRRYALNGNQPEVRGNEKVYFLPLDYADYRFIAATLSQQESHDGEQVIAVSFFSLSLEEEHRSPVVEVF